jgi:hypothetical protein
MGSSRRISTGPSSFRRWRSWPWQAHAIRTANFSSAEARPIGTILKPRRWCHSQQSFRAASVSWQELTVRGLIIGLAVTVALRLVDDWIFAHGGLFVIAAVVGGAGIHGLLSSLRGRSQSHDIPLSDIRPAVDGGRFMRST